MRLRALLLALAAAAALPGLAAAPAAAQFGLATASATLSSAQAGEQTDLRLELELASDRSGGVDEAGFGAPYGLLRDLRVDLPPGLVADLGAVDTCAAADFVASLAAGGCPFSSQVGIARVHVGLSPNLPLTVPIFNVEATRPDTVARLGFFVSAVPSFVELRLRSDGDYGVSGELAGASTVSALQDAELTVWGVPGAAAHDNERLTVVESVSERRSSSPPRSFGRAAQPFLSNPTRCGEPLQVRFAVASYEEPGEWRRATAPLGEIVGCPLLRFEPRLTAVATVPEAASPSGLDVVLELPEAGGVASLANSHLRAAELRLPRGVTIAAGAADGLAACDEAAVGYGVSPPPPSACPDAAKLAAAVLDSPALERPLQGAVYLRTPAPGRPLRLWLVVDERGVRAKLPGELRLDGADGRLVASFAELPELPLRRLELRFKGGARGVLATPSACGEYRGEYDLVPWSGGALARGPLEMRFDRNCAAGGFGPRLSAGSSLALAARHSPFLVELGAESGADNLAGVRLVLPPGVLARLAGVELCAELAAALGACSPASRVGSVGVSLGPGPSPLWVPQSGRDPASVHLAGPYRGAPYSLVATVPAQAGPFDFGPVVVRSALEVEPRTARVTVVSDPLPQFLEGIPLSYRRLRVELDRERFVLNPSSCRPLGFSGVATAASGAVAPLAQPFQLAGCSRLGFRPRLALRLRGARRGANPALRATVRMPGGRAANIAGAEVTLPPRIFLDTDRIGTICTRARFAAGNCPPASVYGWAEVRTPLLDRPLRGPVYLRSSRRPLPDLVADLHGAVRIVLVGALSSARGGMRASFEGLPDAPFERFVLAMPGGRRGLLINSRHLCAGAPRAEARLRAQNGARSRLRPRLLAGCGAGRGEGLRRAAARP